MKVHHMKVHNGEQWEIAKILVNEEERLEKLHQMQIAREELEAEARPVRPSSSNRWVLMIIIISVTHPRKTTAYSGESTSFHHHFEKKKDYV